MVLIIHVNILIYSYIQAIKFKLLTSWVETEQNLRPKNNWLNMFLLTPVDWNSEDS